MRLLWYSNAPFSATGYGNQTKLFVPRLQKLGHDMAILAFYGLEGGILNWNGVRVYPRGYHMYGNDVYSAHAKHFEADLIISLIDIWVLDPSAQGNPHGIPIAAWFPIDSEPMSPAVLDKAKQVFAPIVFSKFGVRMAEEAGLPHFYVPHGVDTKIFMPGDKAEARRKSLLPEDAFVVTMVAANKGAPSRKAFQQQLEAFAMLRRKHKDALLYLHTTKAENGENGGVNLVELCKYLGLDTGKSGSVVFADQYTNLVGFPEPYMVNVYQFSDVVMNVSMGEGFGIPILEAQACGTPVIVGDWTSMPELCFGGWKVSRADCTPFWTPLTTYQFVPHTGAIYDLLERAYGASSEKRLQLSRRARAGALEYDADTVTERYWKPLLEMLHEQIKSGLTKHQHQWIAVGLYNPDGSMSVPCKDCGAELRRDGRGERVLDGGFSNPQGLKFTEPDGLEWLLLREAERDYGLGLLELGPGSRVVDIGAHVGVMSMTLAKRYGCRVEAYEPDPDNFRRLEANIAANGLAVECVQKAVTGDGREVRIGGGGENSGGHSIYGADGPTIPSVSFRDVLGALPIDLLKVDCEGAEFEFLDPELLRGRVNAIRGELHRGSGDADALLARLMDVVPDTKMTIQGEGRKANGTSRGLDRGTARPERVEVAAGERGPNGDLVHAGAVGQVGEL